jgi:predicted transposase YdaD
VFEISWLTDEQVAMFQSDFKVVANFFVNMRKNENYIPDDKTTIKHVDEVLKLLSVMSGDRRYEEIFADDRKDEVTNMSSLVERLVNQGRSEGRAESIERLLRKGKSPEEIHDLLDYPMEEILRVERELSAVK